MFFSIFANRFFLIGCIAGSLTATGLAEDWPQWMGPNRDNRWTAEGIIEKFPAGGPDMVWSTGAAGGYAGPAVQGDRLIMTDFVTEADVKISNFDRRPAEGVERVVCLNSLTGAMLWEHKYPVTYAISYPAGPRCTPVIDDGKVYTLGAEGNLKCLTLSAGEVVWERALKEDYSTNSALWGYAGHPLIDGNKLICVAGGDGTHTIALDKATGKQLWAYGSASEQGYVPPSIVSFAGRRQLLTASPDWLAALDPETGEELWTTEYQATNGSVIMTPLITDSHLFFGGYSKRNLMLELNQQTPGVTVLFRDKPKLALSPVNVQPFLNGDTMYGMDGDGSLIAAKIPSGERLWETGQPVSERPAGTATAFIVKHQDRFFLFTEKGDLVIANLSIDGYTEIDRAKVIEPTNNAFGRPVIWCAPAFANGKMYVKSDSEIISINLSTN